MMQTGIWALWLVLYWHEIEQVGDPEKGYGKRIAVWGMTLGILAGAKLCGFLGAAAPGVAALGGWLAVTAVLFLYVLFYGGKPFGEQWWKALLPGFLMAFCSLAQGQEAVLTGGVMAAVLLLLCLERECLRVWNGALNLALFLFLCYFAWQFQGRGDQAFVLGILGLETVLFLSLEGSMYLYQKSFEAKEERLRNNFMSHQYQEIREIYLNMRGWRHDYHNHLQVMKAHMAAGRREELQRYLDDLEQNLDKVDTYVKSGNLMADAILNSKLTLAKQRRIRVSCKAVLPGELSVEDVDLCVILGNLLDNALEACEKISEEQRFLRVYIAAKGAQLYISVQNSAKEELGFEERNYISSKRGNHGLGMKRVKALTDKYEGYLTLANEPGIFAAEVTLPL